MYKTEINKARIEFIRHNLIKPLVLSSGTISEAVEARVSVHLACNGIEAIGRGSIMLSDIWAWPGGVIGRSEKLDRMKKLCLSIGSHLPSICPPASHPLALGLRLHETVTSAGDEIPGCIEVDSVLARSLCASPFDAAIHDGAGIALGRSAFSIYDSRVEVPEVDAQFEYGVIESIRRGMIPRRDRLSAWFIASPVTTEDEIARAVKRSGYRCFKIKTTGVDVGADVDRTVFVHRAAVSAGATEVRLVVDSNEANPDADSVCEYLKRLEKKDPGVFESVDYLEQPTGRDITQHRYDWREVTAIKPVLLDEGHTGFEILEIARNQGWSGFALKTCKGHSFVLATAAWAIEKNMKISIQDLTNPGYSAIHAGLIAAHFPTINGVEINSPQFTPAANTEWLPRLSRFFSPSDGSHAVPEPIPPGLGSLL